MSLAARAKGSTTCGHQSLEQPGCEPRGDGPRVRTGDAPDFLLMWNLEAPKNYWKGDSSHCVGHGWTAGDARPAADGRDAIQELLAMSAWDYESEKESFPTSKFRL